MAFFKECCCWRCRNDADVSDLAEDDVRSAVVLCDGCEAAGCDPFDHIGGWRCNEQEGAPHVEERIACPRDACNGEGNLLGILGRLAHYRCRACGIDFNNEGGYES